MLMILLPSASPIASAEFPLADAAMVTVISGADAAQAATIIAIRSARKAHRCATPTTPRTNNSPPIPASTVATNKAPTCGQNASFIGQCSHRNS